MSTKLIYDLNIYRLEVEPNVWSDKWNIHTYLYNGKTTIPVLEPIELTDYEASQLGLGSGDFTEIDSWYGLDWLLEHPTAVLSKRLLEVFSSLPKYEENK